MQNLLYNGQTVETERRSGKILKLFFENLLLEHHSGQSQQ